MKKKIAVVLIIVGATLLGWSVWSVFNQSAHYRIDISSSSKEIIKITEKLKLQDTSLQAIKIYSSSSSN